MHKVTSARCFLCSGSDYSKQKFQAHRPHRLQIPPLAGYPGKVKSRDGILQTLSFRWDFHPLDIPQASLQFLLLFIPPCPKSLFPYKAASAPGTKNLKVSLLIKSHLALFPLKPSTHLLLIIVICTEIMFLIENIFLYFVLFRWF